MEILKIIIVCTFVLNFCGCLHFSNICNCNPKREQYLCTCTRREITDNVDVFNTVFSISSEQISIRPKIDLNDIEELRLIEIPIHTFYITGTSKLNSLKTFSISSCNTTSIDTKSLNGMTNMMFLSFPNNMISHLHEDTFKHNLELEHINLSNNIIENLPDNLFYNLRNLKRINLSNNKIFKLSNRLFDMNKQLQCINLKENNIQVLPSNLFQNLINIKLINLANNKIQILPENLFANLSGINSINLNNNKISHVSSNLLKHNSNLEELYLSNNSIQTISSSIIKSLKRLYHLDLVNNSLICDCTLKDFFSVYKDRDISGNVTCFKPDQLAKKNFETLSQKDLVCVPHIKRCIEKPKQISCEIFGYPTPDIHWSLTENCKNCHQLSFSNIAGDRYWTNLTILDDTIPQQIILNISNIVGSDYYLHNTAFKNNATLVEVYGTAPKILNCSEAIQNLTNTATISCSIFCKTSPKYSWTFEDKKINNKYNTSIVQNGTNTYWSTLIIPFTIETEGRYMFYVENEYGGNQFVYNLKCKDKENSMQQEIYTTYNQNPRTIEHHIPLSLTADVNMSQLEVHHCEKYYLKHTVTISCKVFGFPVSEITWLFNKVIIKNEFFYKHTFKSLNQYSHWANLTIFYISSETAGLYSLQVSNSKGRVHHSEIILAEEESSYLMTGIITISSCVSIFLIFLIVFVIYCTYFKSSNDNNKAQTIFYANTQEEYYQEQIFSTNDSRKKFNSADLMSFNNANNMGHSFHTTNTSNVHTLLINLDDEPSENNNMNYHRNQRYTDSGNYRHNYESTGHRETLNPEASPLINNQRNTINSEDIIYYLPDQ